MRVKTGVSMHETLVRGGRARSVHVRDCMHAFTMVMATVLGRVCANAYLQARVFWHTASSSDALFKKALGGVSGNRRASMLSCYPSCPEVCSWMSWHKASGAPGEGNV